MLTIGKLGAGQERYYLQKVAEGAEDYYSGEGEAQGYWLGDAAEDLGLQGQVKADQLTAMLTGRNPLDGEPLGMRAVPGRGPVPGFDLTFSAPKSVSLLWALGGPVAAVEVSQAHAESVQAALAYVQREACWTRRGAGGKEFVHGQGLPRRRLRAPLLASRRPPAPHPRPDRQRDQGAGRPLEPPAPPLDLRPRQDRRLHL